MKRGLLYGLAFIGGLFLFFVFLIVTLSFLIGLKRGATPFREAVGVLEIRGLIAETDEKIRILEDFLHRKEIKAIVVRIESPGGTVGASQELYEELKKVSQRKPVVVSLGSVAASGAYYVALGGNKIFASPGTITGSIGVIIQVPNLEKLMEKVGIRPVVIKSGRYKDLLSYYRIPSAEEKRLLRETLAEIHSQFMKAVAERRGLKLEEVRKLADGRIFTGERALKLGLIDALGNFSRAVEEAARMGHIKGRPHLVYGQGRKVWWKALLEGRESINWETLLTSPLYLWMAGL